MQLGRFYEERLLSVMQGSEQDDDVAFHRSGEDRKETKKTLHLPLELMEEILEAGKPGLSRHEALFICPLLPTYEVINPDISDVDNYRRFLMNSRLVSRFWHDAATRILFRKVTVWHDDSSIERFEKIATSNFSQHCREISIINPCIQSRMNRRALRLSSIESSALTVVPNLEEITLQSGIGKGDADKAMFRQWLPALVQGYDPIVNSTGCPRLSRVQVYLDRLDNWPTVSGDIWEQSNFLEHIDSFSLNFTDTRSVLDGAVAVTKKLVTHLPKEELSIRASPYLVYFGDTAQLCKALKLRPSKLTLNGVIPEDGNGSLLTQMLNRCMRPSCSILLDTVTIETGT